MKKSDLNWDNFYRDIIDQWYKDAGAEVVDNKEYVVASKEQPTTRYKYDSKAAAIEGVSIFNQLGIMDAKIYTVDDYFHEFPSAKVFE